MALFGHSELIELDPGGESALNARADREWLIGGIRVEWRPAKTARDLEVEAVIRDALATNQSATTISGLRAMLSTREWSWRSTQLTTKSMIIDDVIVWHWLTETSGTREFLMPFRISAKSLVTIPIVSRAAERREFGVTIIYHA